MRIKMIGLFAAALAAAVLGSQTVTTHSSAGRPDVALANSYSTVLVNAEGLDTCSTYPASTWNAIYPKHNLWGLGFYLGGATADAVNCFEPGPTWLAALDSGYKVMPIWDALQAPCSANSRLMSTNATTAASQGVTAGNNAIAASNAIGLGAPNIIYLDMESYSSSCEAPVRSYVSAFVNTLHNNAYKAGIYGSACSPDMDIYAGLAHPPDDAWIADYNGIDGAGVSGTVSCVSSTNWTGGRRLHQYAGGVNFTFDGTTVHVDEDCLYGQVDGSAGVSNGCGY
jgi:hypothetical protein